MNDDFSLKLDSADPLEQETQLWMEATGLDLDTLCGAVETVLFMSDRPVKAERIRRAIDKEGRIPLRAIDDCVSRLQKDYDQSHRGVCLAEVGGGLQFRTRPSHVRFVQNLVKASSLALSPTALEVLAMVAYRQPLSRADIDKKRGVESSHILRALMDRKLIKVCGRSDDAGRPVVYGTTDEFLGMFNLARLEDLPPEHELQALADNQDVGDLCEIKEMVRSSMPGQKGQFDFNELDELDELAKTIKEVNSETVFVKSIKDEEKKKGEEEESVEKKSAFDILEEFVSSSFNRNEDRQEDSDSDGESAN